MNLVNFKIAFSLILVISTISSCIEGGTHGSIKNYQFPVSKYLLEKTVSQVISKSPNIQRDTIKDYYNDGTNYISIIINDGEIGKYIFRFYGDKKDWDTSLTSEIAIAYAWDNEGNGGSQGNKGLASKPRLRTKLVDLFENEFISKLDAELGVKHSVSD